MFHGANERILRDFSPITEPTMWTGWTEEKFADLVRLINASREKPNIDLTDDINDWVRRWTEEIIGYVVNEF
mgnify:CR=1 FL=1